MKNVRRILALATGVVILLLLGQGHIAVAQGPNLITNGSFEVGTCAGPGQFQRVFAPDSTAIAGWEVFSAEVDWMCDNTYWQSFNGTRDIDLDGLSQGGMRQSFPTQVGATYLVTFYMAGNNFDGPALKTMQVSVAGVTQNLILS